MFDEKTKTELKNVNGYASVRMCSFVSLLSLISQVTIHLLLHFHTNSISQLLAHDSHVHLVFGGAMVNSRIDLFESTWIECPSDLSTVKTLLGFSIQL